MFSGVILTITVSIALGLSMLILNLWGQRRKDAPGPPREIEQEMTVSEFNALIEERELAARAPLESQIAELKNRLNEKDQDVPDLQKSKTLTR